MKIHSINTIEKKLKEDAKAFKTMPPPSVHDNVMKNITSESIDTLNVPTKQRLFTWQSLLPALPAALATALVMSLYIFVNSDDFSTTHPTNAHLSDELLSVTKAVDKINVTVVSQAIESQLTTEMELEKQALMKDFYYFKTFFALDESLYN